MSFNLTCFIEPYQIKCNRIRHQGKYALSFVPHIREAYSGQFEKETGHFFVIHWLIVRSNFCGK